MTKIEDYFKQDAYFAVLVYGPHINEQIEMLDDILLAPLDPLYQDNYVAYIKDFLNQFNHNYNKLNTDTFENDFSDNVPVCLIIDKKRTQSTDLNEIINFHENNIEKAKHFLALISGESSNIFFKILRTEQRKLFKTEIDQFTKIHRLWLNQDEQENFIRKTEQIIESQQFAVSLFEDANRESNFLYKIARYFMVLEGITKSPAQSRNHIKKFFRDHDFNPELNSTNETNNHNLENIDAVEVSGLMRAKLFHGVKLKYKYFKKIISREDYNYIINNPKDLTRHMRDLCVTAFELQLN